MARGGAGSVGLVLQVGHGRHRRCDFKTLLDLCLQSSPFFRRRPATARLVLRLTARPESVQFLPDVERGVRHVHMGYTVRYKRVHHRVGKGRNPTHVGDSPTSPAPVG